MLKRQSLFLILSLSFLIGSTLVHAQTWTKAYAFNDPYGNLININFTYYQEMTYGENYPFEVQFKITKLQAGDRIHIHTAIIAVSEFTVEFAIAKEFSHTGESAIVTLGFYATSEAKSGPMHLTIDYTTFISGGQYNGERTEYIDEITFNKPSIDVAEFVILPIAIGILVGAFCISIFMKKRYRTENS